MLKNRSIFFTATFLMGLISLLIPDQAFAQYQYDNSFNQNNYPPIGATYSNGRRTKKTVRQSKFNQKRTMSAQTRKVLLRRWLRQSSNTR
jgi:hypothetical protein